MKFCIKKIGFFLLSFLSGSLYAETPNIQYWKTMQGVPVYFVARPQIPMLDMAIVFAAGSAYEANAWGLASFTASLLDEGTTTRSAIDIASGFDQVGAQLEAGADRDTAIVSLRTLTQEKYFHSAFDLFLEVLAHPSFPESALNRVRNQLMDAIRQNLQDPLQVAQETFFSSLYANQGYGHPVLGTLATVKAIQLSQIKEFYQRFYSKQNAKIVLVGAVDLKQAHEIAEKIAGALHEGQAAPPLAKMTQAKRGQHLFVSMPVTQNAIIIGENAINRNDPEYFNLLVANHVLGGLPMTSLLFDQIRNHQGLAYSVYSGFVPLQAKGPFMILMQTRSEKSQQAVETAQTTLSNFLKKGPTLSELKAAKLNLMGSFPLKIASNQGVLLNVINIAFYQLPLDYLQTYCKKVNAVQIGTAKKAFSDVVQVPLLNTVVAGVNHHHD